MGICYEDICVYMCVCAYIHTWIYMTLVGADDWLNQAVGQNTVCMYICVYVYVCEYMCVCVCVYVCVCVCVYTCTCV